MARIPNKGFPFCPGMDQAYCKMQKEAYEEFKESIALAEIFVEMKANQTQKEAKQAQKEAKQTQKEASKKKRHGKKNRGKGRK